MIEQDDLAGLFLEEQVRPPRPPDFPVNSEQGMELRSALSAIEKESRTYCAAVALMSFSAAQNQAYLGSMMAARASGRKRTMENTLWNDWQFMAARSGVLAARNLQEALISVNWHLRAKGEFALVDHKALRAAKTALKDLFPDSRAARDAVAHPEFYHRDVVDTTGGPSKATMTDYLTGDGYRATLKGKEHFCSLSQASAAAVCEIVTSAFAAFDAYALEAYASIIRRLGVHETWPI